MALHSKSWSGVKILVFGATPMIPMRIEQSLAVADPSNEVNVDSFEDYDQAYDFCKTQQNVGLIFMLENAGKAPPLGIFRQLAKPYEDSRGPCFSVLVHENGETLQGHSSIRFSKGKIIDYVSATALLNPVTAYPILTELWKKYIDSIQEFIAPEALTLAIHEIVEPILSSADRILIDRVANCLSQKLSVSWWEALAIRWESTLKALEQADPTLWKTLKSLQQLTQRATSDEAIKTSGDLFQSKAALATRVASFIQLLIKHPKPEHFLNEITSLSKPGAPGLIKQVTALAPNIMLFLKDREKYRDQYEVAA